jgi:hypothetical protein
MTQHNELRDTELELVSAGMDGMNLKKPSDPKQPPKEPPVKKFDVTRNLAR